MVNENLYIYAYDEEGDLVFIRKLNKHVVIGGKEEKSIVITTDIPENAQNFNETSDAKTMIEYIQNGDVVFDDEFVDTEKLKLAYKDKYGNFYDRLTDKVVYINDDGDDIGESMEMEFSEAKQILNESGYQLIDEALEGPATSKQLWTLFKLTRQDYRGKDLSKEEASKMIGDLIAKIKNGENKTEPKAKKSKPVEDDSNSPVKVGEIYHRNWGYSMCINTYFKVLGVKGKKARVVELDKKAVSGSLMQGRVVPIETPRSNAEELLAIIKNDGTLRIKLYGNYETYRKWDGKSDYEDHMD